MSFIIDIIQYLKCLNNSLLYHYPCYIYYYIKYVYTVNFIKDQLDFCLDLTMNQLVIIQFYIYFYICQSLYLFSI